MSHNRSGVKQNWMMTTKSGVQEKELLCKYTGINCLHLKLKPDESAKELVIVKESNN